MSFYEEDFDDSEEKKIGLIEIAAEIADLDLSSTAPDANFTKLIQILATKLSMTDRQIASSMRISVPTASRWMNGVTSPHWAMRESVRRFALRYIENLSALL